VLRWWWWRILSTGQKRRADDTPQRATYSFSLHPSHFKTSFRFSLRNRYPFFWLYSFVIFLFFFPRLAQPTTFVFAFRCVCWTVEYERLLGSIHRSTARVLLFFVGGPVHKPFSTPCRYEGTEEKWRLAMWAWLLPLFPPCDVRSHHTHKFRILILFYFILFHLNFSSLSSSPQSLSHFAQTMCLRSYVKQNYADSLRI